jgi:AmmeMemoRadiSam system protein A
MRKFYKILAITLFVLTITYFGYNISVIAEETMANLKQNKTNEFNLEERKQLLQLARTTLNNYFEKKKPTEVADSEIPKKFKQERGCFVTLTTGKNHDLRGCIGYIKPVKSLYNAIIDNALSAALQDWRFSPVKKEELSEIEIEISVLTVPQKLEFSSPDDMLAKIRPGIDGVYLFYGSSSSTYLPQVWEKLTDKKEFFSSLCMKGGAPPDCWKRKEVEIYTYQAEYFNESEVK